MKKILVIILIFCAFNYSDQIKDIFSARFGNDGNASASTKNIGKKVNPLKVAKKLDSLTVQNEVEEGYDRDAFYHWSDADGDGCDARDEVLSRQNDKNAPCGSDRGKWVSVYDGETTRDAGEFDVDHMVPLAEAYGSGAYAWDSAKREAYANDLEGYTLIAVSATSNRSKSDQDPAEWLPENRSFICQYAARWVIVKSKWNLTIDPAEKKALRKIFTACKR